MKSFYFTFFILILTSLTGFSQIEIPSKIDTTILSERLSMKLKNLDLKQKQQTHEMYKLPEFKSQLSDTVYIKRRKNAGKEILSFNQNSSNDMPVAYPDGYWDTPVMVQDSTIDFKLQILKPQSLK